MTNPNSIYIKGKLNFKGYKLIDVYCFVDTGASLCLASKHIITEELWENTPQPLQIMIANQDIVKVDKVCRDLQIRISGEIFTLPSIHQQESGIDILLGNNFCQLYGPFTQFLDRIILHLEGNSVLIQKATKAYRYGKPGFLETMKKDSKRIPEKGTNIAPERISEEEMNEQLFVLNQHKYQTIL